MSGSGDTESKNLSVQTIAGGRSNAAWVWVLCAVLGLGLIYTTVQMRKAQDKLGEAEQVAAAAKQDLAGVQAVSERAKNELTAAQKAADGLAKDVSGLKARLAEVNDKAVAHGKVAAAKADALSRAIDDLNSKLGEAIASRTESAKALGDALKNMKRAKTDLSAALSAHGKAQAKLQTAVTDNARAEADVKVLKRALETTTERLKAAESQAEVYREEAARFASQ